MRLRGLLGFYAKSPFVQLQKHGEHVVQAASHLPELTRAFADGDYTRVSSVKDAITEAEHAADAAKNELRSSLPKGKMLPVDRRDILHYLSSQDSIADLSQDVAKLMAMRKIEVPKNTGTTLVELADKTWGCIEEFNGVVQHFGDLVESSFRGPEAQEILGKIEAIGYAESRVDRAEERVAATVFDREFPGDPIDVYLLSKVIDRLGGVADAAERTANRLRVMLSL